MRKQSGGGKDLHTKVQLQVLANNFQVMGDMLVDSGCMGSAINKVFVKKPHLPT